MHPIKYYFPAIKECVENFCINIDHYDLTDTHHYLYTDAIAQHKRLFAALLISTSPEEIETNVNAMITHTIEHDIPYLFVYGELITVTRQLLGNLIKEKNFEDLAMVDHHFSIYEKQIESLYLIRYLDQLHQKITHRLARISELFDKKLLVHYENHLKWMLKLIHFIRHVKEENYPELRHTHCDFGKWLHATTFTYLISNEHFKVIENLHVNLHDLAANLINYLRTNDTRSATLIHFMQRIDYTSLEIGNEIAILNEIEVSSKDPLTDLLSRRLLNKILTNQLEISQAAGQELSLIMCDLDYFKKINDTCGHLAGDAVLENFADLLRTTFRQSDYIFRFGGEEFLIVLPSTGQNAAYTLGEKLFKAARTQEVVYENDLIRYTLSVGVHTIVLDASLPLTEERINSYLAAADLKMYTAKTNGRNRVE